MAGIVARKIIDVKVHEVLHWCVLGVPIVFNPWDWEYLIRLDHLLITGVSESLRTSLNEIYQTKGDRMKAWSQKHRNNLQINVLKDAIKLQIKRKSKIFCSIKKKKMWSISKEKTKCSLYQRQICWPRSKNIQKIAGINRARKEKSSIFQSWLTSHNTCCAFASFLWWKICCKAVIYIM